MRNLTYEQNFFGPFHFLSFRSWTSIFLSSEALVDRQDSAPRSAFLTQIGTWESWPRFPWRLFLRSKGEPCSGRVSTLGRTSAGEAPKPSLWAWWGLPAAPIHCLWGPEGKSWQAVPSACDLLAEPMADFPAFPVWDGQGPCEAKLWDSSIHIWIELYLPSGISDLWGVGYNPGSRRQIPASWAQIDGCVDIRHP